MNDLFLSDEKFEIKSCVFVLISVKITNIQKKIKPIINRNFLELLKILFFFNICVLV